MDARWLPMAKEAKAIAVTLRTAISAHERHESCAPLRKARQEGGRCGSQSPSRGRKSR